MRKSLVVLVLSVLLVAFTASSVLAGIVVKAGPDLSGNMELTAPGEPGSLEGDVKMGITIGAFLY